MSGPNFLGDDSRRHHRVLLLRAILSRAPGELSLPGTRDPAGLIELARRFALLPRLSTRAKSTQENRELSARLEVEAVGASARAAARTAEAFVLSTVLRAESIEHVFLKGAGLAAHGVAAVSGDRHTDDIDVLAPAYAREETLAVIDSLGYLPDHDSDLPAVGGGTLRDQEFTTSAHAEMALVSPRGVRLDLHWFVPDAGTTEFADVLARTVLAGPEGGQIPVPDPPLLLAQICDHVVLHHRARPAYLPRHLADLVDLIDTFGDGLWDEARTLGSPTAIRFSRLLLKLAREGRLPPGLLFPGPGVQASLEATAELLDVLARAKRDFRQDPSRLYRKIVPSREFVANSYGIEPDDPKIPLCYLHRLITLRFLFRPLRG